MAMITMSDVKNSVLSSVKNHYDEMSNTKFLVSTTVTAADLARERVAAVRQSFNNNSTSNAAKTGSLFRNIFKGLDDKKRALDGAEDEFISSGTKEENEAVEITSRPSLTADTISRNQTAYDIAGIQVKAVVAQTQTIVTTLSDQTTYLKNIDANLQKLMTAVTKGFESINKQNEEAAKDQEMYNKKGYLNMDAYFKQLKQQTATQLQPLKAMANVFKDPKQAIGMMTDALFEHKAFKNLFSNIEDSISKAFTNSIDRLGDSRFLKNTKNPLVMMLRNILIPGGGTGDLITELTGASGIKKAERAQFDNITHRTINDVIPGLLERILAQNEMTAQAIQQFTGIQGKASGTTYDMKSGKFTTKSAIQKQLSEQMKQTVSGNKFESSLKLDDKVNLSEYQDIIEWMVFAMASLDEPIRNFWARDPNFLINMVQWGKPSRHLTKRDIGKFIKFYNLFKEDALDAGARRQAQQQIIYYYNDLKRQLDAQFKEITGDVNSGLLRGDQLGHMDGMNAMELSANKFIDYEKKINLKNAPERNKAGSAMSYGEIGREFTGNMSSAANQFMREFRMFGKDLADGIKQMLTPGSIYVHDSVLIEYVRALQQTIAPRANLDGIKGAWNTHLSAHKNVNDPGKKSAASTGRTHGKYQKSNEDIDNLEPTQLTGNKKIDDMLNSKVAEVKLAGMRLAQQAGYHGFDDQLKQAGANDKGAGKEANALYSMEQKTMFVEIENAQNSGVLDPEKANELRQIMQQSKPEDYKSNMLKTMAQWSPAVLGGILAGPYGALTGLGIRHIMRRTAGDNVHSTIERMRKNARQDQKAKAKLDTERAEISAQLRKLHEEGRLTDEELAEANQIMSTASPDEYKGGLVKWAKRLGPAAIAAMFGIGGPLGILLGAFVGKRLSETTATKMRRRLKKIKPSNDVWDDQKRDKLIQQIDAKIAEIEQSRTPGEPDPDADDALTKLHEYRRDIVGASKAKLSWYLTSLPGILSLIWKVRKLPGAILRGIGSSAKILGNGIVQVGRRAKSEINKRLDTYMNEHSGSGTAKAIGAIRKIMGGTMGAMGAIAGIVTGRTQKRAVARANRAASEVQQLLRDNPATANVAATTAVAAEIATSNDFLSSFLALFTGHSVSTSDAVTHALLKKILLHLNPNADMGDVDALEHMHTNETGSRTVRSSETDRAIAQSVDGTVIKNGQIKHDGSDQQVLSAASTAIANIDTESEMAAKRKPMESASLMAADSNETKTKIRGMYDETARNLRNKEKKESGEGGGSSESNGNSIINSIKNALNNVGGGLGAGTVLSTIGNAAINGLGTATGALAGFKLFQNAFGSYTDPINENTQSRGQHARRSHTRDAAIAVSGSRVAAKTANSISDGIGVFNDLSKTRNVSVGTIVGNHVSQSLLGSSLRNRLDDVANSVKGGASRALGAITSNKYFKAIKSKIDDFVSALTKSKFCTKIGEFLGKVTPKNAGNGILKKIFSGAGKYLKKLARALGIAAVILDIVARMVEKVASVDPQYLEKMSQNMGDNPIVNIGIAIQYFFNKCKELEEQGEDGFFEMLVKSAAAAGVDMLITSAVSGIFAPYAIIKCGIALLGLGLDLYIGDQDAKYPFLRAIQFLCDDLVTLDANVIQGIADLLVDAVEVILKLFTLNIVKVVFAICDIFKDLWNIIKTSGKSITIILADLLLIPLCGVANLVQIFFPNGFGEKLLGVRKALVQVLDGEIGISDFFDAVGASTDEEEAASDAKRMSDVRASVGRGRGFGRGFGSGGGDLYQESAMYRNAPFDMYNSGCGPIALTAALRKQGINANPMATAANLGGYRVSDGGTMPGGILNVGNAMGGRFSPGSTDSDSILAAAKSGKPVVMMGQGAAFGSGMHYMTAVGASGNNLLVRDPLSPNLRRIPADEIGSVSNAIYGRGGGRGIGEAMSGIMNAGNTILNSFTNLFGGWFSGNSGNNDTSGSTSSGSSSSGSSGSSGGTYVTSSAVAPGGNNKSVDGSVTYPPEMRKDPTGKFPNNGNYKYSEMLPAVKDLLIAQYKYTLILPSVVAAIMRGETNFGRYAHEKNLGNIKKSGSRDGGTKRTTNRIYDSVERSNADYEAYYFWGESIYRIGNFLSTISRYKPAVGNKDTLRSLQAIAAGGYATASGYAESLYNYWSAADMKTLKEYDQIAINRLSATPISTNRASRSGPRAAAYGRGLGDIVGGLMSAGDTIMNGFTNLFGGFFGGNPTSGDSGSSDASSVSEGGYSAGADNTGMNAGSVTGGSMAERVQKLLSKDGASVRISSPFGSTNPVHGGEPHTGIDFAAPGGTNIYAPTDGTVIGRVDNMSYSDLNAKGNASMGNYIKMRDSQGRIHWFEHMQYGSPTKATAIKAGDYLGKVGTTGASTGNHLHYQINEPGANYHSPTDPNSVAGYGRQQLPQGGGTGEDYTEILSNIYTVLQVIAENTGTSISFMKGQSTPMKTKPATTRTGAGRGTRVGIGYQRVTRGY